MSGDKRTQKKVGIEQRRAQVAELYLRQKSQVEIAQQLEVDQSTISLDIKAIQKAWRDSAIVDMNELRFRELERIDKLEREYWSAWESSLETKEITSTKKIANGKKIATGVSEGRIEAQVRKEDRDGDPRYLQGIQWCITKRCDILGLDAPVISAQVNYDKDTNGIRERLARQLDSLAARNRAQPDYQDIKQ